MYVIVYYREEGDGWAFESASQEDDNVSGPELDEPALMAMGISPRTALLSAAAIGEARPVSIGIEERAAWADLVSATEAACYMNTQDSRSSYEESAAACKALRGAVKGVESFGVDLNALGVDLAHLMVEDGR